MGSVEIAAKEFFFFLNATHLQLVTKARPDEHSFESLGGPLGGIYVTDAATPSIQFPNSMPGRLKNAIACPCGAGVIKQIQQQRPV